MAISMAADFCESFKRQPSGFADPGAQHDFVAKRRGRFVVDLMSQDNPTNGLLRFRIGNSSPMCGGNILDPPKVNSVVYVILLIDISR